MILFQHVNICEPLVCDFYFIIKLKFIIMIYELTQKASRLGVDLSLV